VTLFGEAVAAIDSGQPVLAKVAVSKTRDRSESG
jgi:hypothetical protein